MRAVVIALAFLAGCRGEAQQPSFPHFDDPQSRVHDAAGILSDEFEDRLVERLDMAEARYGPQLAVVTVPSLHGYAIEEFSLLYAREWGIGDAERDDGLQIMVAPNERKVRLEVGTGIERAFGDLYAKTVVDAMLRHFRTGDYESGISEASEMLIERMRSHPTLPANDNDSGERASAA